MGMARDTQLSLFQRFFQGPQQMLTRTVRMLVLACHITIRFLHRLAALDWGWPFQQSW